MEELGRGRRFRERKREEKMGEEPNERERKNERVMGDSGYIWKQERRRRAYCPYRPAPESLLPNGAGVKGK